MPIPADWLERLRTYVAGWESAGSLLPEEYLGDRPFRNFVLTERANTWDEVIDWIGEFDANWCFRGQQKFNWNLNTSLDRAVKVAYCSQNEEGYYHLDREFEERELVVRFQQQAQHYFHHVPERDDLGSWLALMQHHRVPTRLLDWTTSPYVALYFAVEVPATEESAAEPCDTDKPATAESFAIWALDRAWLRERAKEILPDLPCLISDSVASRVEATNQLLRYNNKPLIVQIEPRWMAQRMAAQQGLLLCKSRQEVTFSMNLVRMIMHPFLAVRPVVRCLAIDRDLRIDCLRCLRDMNIHAASLFPGIDGFSQSLGMDLEIKVQSLAAGNAG